MSDTMMNPGGPAGVSEKRFRWLMESAYDGILVLDADSGTILDVNTPLLMMLEYSAEELVGKHAWNIGLFDTQTAKKAALRVLQKPGTTRFNKLPLQTKNSPKKVHVEFVSNVYQEEGRAVIQCHIRGVPAAPVERQIARAASASGNLKYEYLGIIAHELRTSLNAILLWTQVIERSRGNRLNLEAGLSAISRSVTAQSRLVEDLLDVSSMAVGEFRCACEPMDVVDVVAHAVADARLGVVEKSIDLNWNCSQAEVVVNGDAGRLFQVCANLFSNAIRFTPPGGKIDVSLRPRDSWAELQVRDTGPGISSDLLPRIFDRFKQAQAPAINKHRGLGLGLAIVKEILALHGGTVKAESPSQARGATFTVMLPLATGGKGFNGNPSALIPQRTFARDFTN